MSKLVIARHGLALRLVGALAPILFAQTLLEARPPTFQHEVLPVLEQKCLACHGETQQMGGLDLRSIASLTTGGSSGPAVVPGNPDSSLLWQMIDAGKMPVAGESLSDGEKRLIRSWIEQGVFPKRDEALAAKREALINDEARSWWAFQSPKRPAIPALSESSRVRTAIDSFVQSKLEARGWDLGPDADRRTLVRRAYLDLIGLPPTPEQADRFVRDDRPDAWERLIDELLASPRYGERWGRHWLDAAGYSDSVGNASDEFRPKSWEFRDYVIRSFNTNKPFDRFIQEQLAGDQIVNYEPDTKPTPEQREALVATGFLRLPPDITDTQTIYQVDKWYDARHTTVETSMKALMGLTIGCAKCHDHKFDPILQEDYYKLVAVLQPALDPERWIGAAIGFGHWPTRYVLDAETEQREAWIEAALNEFPEIRQEDRRLRREYDRYRQAYRDEMTRDLAMPDGTEAEPFPELTESMLEEKFPELAAKAAGLRARKQAYEDLTPDRVWALWDVSKTPSPTHILIRGNYLAPGDEVDPGIPAVLDDPEEPFQFPEPADAWNHTGRRLTLARWLTRADNPLTSRVFVNRVWQYHFGEGIVRTPDDFGSQGSPPSHPELLDWLAVEFVESGWDLKALHKKIMLSTVYRQSSAEDSQKLADDPTNLALWRKTPLRLEAEVIRDSILAVSGDLDLEPFGEYEPVIKRPDGQWILDPKKANLNRRSVYIAQSRTRPHGFLLAFDAPTMDNQNAPKRFRSALPVQALALMNSPFIVRSAEALSERTRAETDGDFDLRLERLFRLIYNRPPEDEETRVAHDLIESADDRDGAWRTLCQSLLASNEFLYSY